jgi:hypothetical protein
MIDPCSSIIQWQQSNIGADAPYDPPTSVADYYHNPYSQYGTWNTYFEINIPTGAAPDASADTDLNLVYTCNTCQELFQVINLITPDTPGYEQFLPENLCNPDQGQGAILSGGPKGYYPPLDKNVMVYLCPGFCCPAEPVVEDCDCWVNGRDWWSFGWEPNPGCCYGCTDPTDFDYDDWATCHVQDTCKDDENGFTHDWWWESGGADGVPGTPFKDYGCIDNDGNAQVP